MLPIPIRSRSLGAGMTPVCGRTICWSSRHRAPTRTSTRSRPGLIGTTASRARPCTATPRRARIKFLCRGRTSSAPCRRTMKERSAWRVSVLEQRFGGLNEAWRFEALARYIPDVRYRPKRSDTLTRKENQNRQLASVKALASSNSISISRRGWCENSPLPGPAVSRSRRAATRIRQTRARRKTSR